MGMYFNRQGKEISSEIWSQLLGDFDYQTVAKSKLKDGKFVSTVWLGLDHGFDGGKPIIFETMVFEKNSASDLDMERYTTLEEAKKGHKRMVNKFKKKIK